MPTKELKASYVLDSSGVGKGVADADKHLSGLTGSLNKVKTAGQSSIGQLGSALAQAGGGFGPLESMASTFGASVDGLGQKFDHLRDEGTSSLQKIGSGMQGVGLLTAGAGGALMALGSGEKQSLDQLKQAVENAGASWDEYDKKFEKAGSQQEKFGNKTEETNRALMNLTTATKSPEKALDNLQLAADIAAKKHISLSDASMLVVKVLEGKGTRTLTEFGIAANKGGDAAAHEADAVALAAAVHGQAAASVDNFSGHMRVLRTEVEDAAAKFGQKYGPAITAAGAGMTILGSGVSATTSILEHLRGAQEAATATTEGMTAATEGLSVAEDGAAASEALALGPIALIIAAVAALAFGIYELVTHWHDVENAVKSAWDAAWSWTKSTWDKIEGFLKAWWPEILGVMTLGIGLVVGEVIRHWGQIESFFASMPGRIEGYFSTAVTWLVRFGMDILTGLWNGVTSAFWAGWHAITDIPGRVEGFFSGAASWLFSAGGQIVQGLENGISGAWGRITGWLKGKVSSLINDVKSGFGLWSPSRVFHDIGTNIVAGLYNGLVDNASMIDAAMTHVTDKVSNAPIVGPTVGAGSAGPSAAYAMAGGGPQAGQTVVINVTVPVNGHVLNDAELMRFIYNGLSSLGQQIGVLFPGLTGSP